MLLETLFMGFRFDMKFIATLLLLVVFGPALFYFLATKKYLLRGVQRILYLLLSIVLIFSFLDFGYYLFFGNEIDVLIFGLLNDGTTEVLSSLLGDMRLIILMLLGIIALLLFRLFFTRYLFVKTDIKKHNSSLKAYMVLLFSIVILAVLARGSVSTFPLSKKTINTIDNSFLSNVVLNPMWHFYYAYRDLKKDNFSTSSQKILKKAKVKSLDDLLTKAGYTANNPLETTSNINPLAKKKPPHVIFVLKEGWSTQVALAQSSQNDVLGAFAKHAKEDYFFQSFFSNAYGTNNSIEALLINSPMKNVSQSSAQSVSFSTSSILPFKRSGYSTLFLSGGSSTWRNHHRFWTTQGFDDYIGRASIEKYFDTKCNNTWGVYDALLFKYLQKTLLERSKNNQPTFTFVLTTNNHPPVELPKEYVSPDFHLEEMGLKSDDTVRYNMLRGYNYQTNALGEFMTWLKHSELKDEVIVVATGDHILKGFGEYFSPSKQYLKYAVPAYFYVPKAYDKLKHISKDIVGSHNDLFPTLYELALSSQKYYNFGTPIMFKVTQNAFGWNEQNRFIFSDGVVDDSMDFYPWDKNNTQRKYLQNVAGVMDDTKRKQITHKHAQTWLQKYILTKEYEEREY
jgi:phosphoglycerol transferase MdoB-like AlkP superfamily enzyme